MITLKAKNLHWLYDTNTEKDLCAHGHVLLRIGEKVVSDESSGDWTLSAAAHNLLKTLRSDYYRNELSQLIPCCGHTFLIDDKSGKAIFFGCPNGIDWQITHEVGKVIHSFKDGEQIETTYYGWVKAVCGFSDQVMDFYEKSEAKDPPESEKEGFCKFVDEWKQMRNAFLK